ncbi:MAG: hypothetical protein H3C71_06650, partial [Flavobacteriales bacterium]|nr:hypothetical protein [Flavobacteriales bacterium]
MFSVSESAGSSDALSLLEKLKSYNLILLSVHKSNESPFKSYRISVENKSFIQTIARKKPTILTVFANAYALSGMNEIKACSGVLLAYQNSEIAQDYAAQLIMGGI